MMEDADWSSPHWFCLRETYMACEDTATDLQADVTRWWGQPQHVQRPPSHTEVSMI